MFLFIYVVVCLFWMSQGHGCSYEHVRPAIIIFTQWESIKTSMINMCMHLIFHLCRSIQTVLLLIIIIRVVYLHLDECSLWFDTICWMKVYSPIFLSFFLTIQTILSVCSFPLVDGDVACGGALTWYFIKLFLCVCVCVCVCVSLSLSLSLVTVSFSFLSLSSSSYRCFISP